MNNLQKIEENFRSTGGSLRRNLNKSERKTANFNDNTFDDRNENPNRNSDGYENERNYGGSFGRNNRDDYDNKRNSNKFVDDDVSSFSEMNNRIQNNRKLKNFKKQ